MNDVTLIAFYYEKGVECLRDRKRKDAAGFFKKSWEAFNIQSQLIFQVVMLIWLIKL